MWSTTIEYDVWIWNLNKRTRFRLRDVKEFEIKTPIKKDTESSLIAILKDGRSYVIATSSERQKLRIICDDILTVK